MSDLPLIMTAAGPVPTAPAALRAILLASVAATNPGYTANLPGSLIEDISSTDVGAIVLLDTARVEAVNDASPYGANAFILTELGDIYGVPIGGATNTSVYCIFTDPDAIGYVIAQGFIVSDGTYLYTVQDGGIIGAGGSTQPLFCRATIQGSWAVPPGTSSQIRTSVPNSISAGLTVNNPETGIPGRADGETMTEYRARVLQAGLAASQGMTRYLKTLLANIEGVQARLISVRQVDSEWEIICGGGDPYEVANAIFMALFAINDLTGSQIGITGITKANPAAVTTDLNHGLVTGQADIFIANAAGMTAINGGPYTVTVTGPKTFTLDGVNSTGYATYTGDGVVTPNNRNVEVTINDYPDQYLIPFVNPPQQTVTMSVLWNTDSPNPVSPAGIAQLAAPALAAYINTIAAGQPINELEMISVFQLAVASILPTPLLSRLVFTVSINGVPTAVQAGTYLVFGDPESYFFAVDSGMTVTPGMSTPQTFLYPFIKTEIAIGGTPVIAAYGPMVGGIIANPLRAEDQGIPIPEAIFINLVGDASLAVDGTTIAIQPGGFYMLPKNLSANVSVNAATGGHRFSAIVIQPNPNYTPPTGNFPPAGPITVRKTIRSYLYQEYNDDDDLQAFIEGFNGMAQSITDWFVQVGLSVYTSASIAGVLLDWVGAGIYGMPRPALPSGKNRNIGPLNTWALNTIELNQIIAIGNQNYYATSDDIYKRILTWHFFKADGKCFTIRWLKRRIMRFLTGINGTAGQVDDTSPVSITFGLDNQVNIRIGVGTRKITAGMLNTFTLNSMALNSIKSVFTPTPSIPNADILKAAIESGACELPFQYSFVVQIGN